MAYAALVSLEKTTHLIMNRVKYYTSFHERQQIASIREYAIFFISFLENFPEKAIRVEAKLRDLANEAEDLIEFFMSNQIQMKQWIFSLSRVNFQRQLKRVTEKIGSITGDMMDDRLCDIPATISSSCRVAAAKNDVVIGLDEDLIAIKGRICGESSKLEVIPIVGMGGIGKTTLARYAYDDSLILERFDIRAWITVSQDYSVDEILSCLVDSMRLLAENKSLMAEKVYKCLKGRRYLIVMDDVWSTEAWDDVRNIFPDDNNGSRIMLTTRLSDVAAYPVSEGCPVHEMKFMDENLSWNLLKQKVFLNCQDCPPELENIGKTIARGCTGLPLAVVLVGGVLPTIAKTRASWEEIAKNVISVVDGKLDKILSLSYMHLPHHLRACFLYIGGFPEDREIHVSRLIKLWVAEGFLRHDENGCKSLEEEAEQCLEDLVKRNLVLVTRRKATGEIKSCSLHDLVRDLCIRKAQELKFLVRYNIRKSIKNMRRISIIPHHYFKIIRSPTIRTFLCVRLTNGSSLPAFVRGFRLLRVLDVVCRYLGSLPLELFELIHLRYLALGSPKEIPAAISNLQNLQTLIINPKAKGSHKNLPQEIWRMQQLRHLVLPLGCGLLNPIYESTLPLENLQTLTEVSGVVCSEKILKMIPNLKKLEIVYVENEENHGQNLISLHQLEKLKVSHCLHLRMRIPAFPTMLKKLSLKGGYRLSEGMSVIGSLPNLQVLKLRCFAFSNDSWETTDGEFPQLRFLLIETSFLKDWITESSHFPRLKSLVLRYCFLLRAIPDGIGEIPTLELIEVDDMNRSLANSAKQIQEEQQDYGNDTFQLRCIHVFQE